MGEEVEQSAVVVIVSFVVAEILEAVNREVVEGMVKAEEADVELVATPPVRMIMGE